MILDFGNDSPTHTHTHIHTHALISYRKIAGDVCEGGDESLYAPYEAECCKIPTQPPTKSK